VLVAVALGVAVAVGVELGSAVFVGVELGRGVFVGVELGSGVFVGVELGTGVFVGVEVGSGVFVTVGVAVGEAKCWQVPFPQGRSSGQSAELVQGPAGWHTCSKQSFVGGQSASLAQGATVTSPLLPIAGKLAPEALLTSTLSAVSVTGVSPASTGIWNVQVARSPVPRGTKIVAHVPPAEVQSALLLQA
jgi:hypothetical protein